MYRGAFGGVGGDFGSGSRVSRVNGVLNVSLKNPLNDPAGENSFGGGNNDHVPGRSRCRGRSHWPRVVGRERETVRGQPDSDPLTTSAGRRVGDRSV